MCSIHGVVGRDVRHSDEVGCCLFVMEKYIVSWCPFKKDICWLVSFHKRYLLVGVLSKKIYVGWCPLKTTLSGSLDLPA